MVEGKDLAVQRGEPVSDSRNTRLRVSCLRFDWPRPHRDSSVSDVYLNTSSCTSLIIMSFHEMAVSFDADGSIRTEVDDGLRLLMRFRRAFPFHSDPGSIDHIKEEDLYSPPCGPGNEYFFYWLEFPLKHLGRLKVGSTAPYRNACTQIDLFKGLLHKLLDPDLSLAEKIDLPWDQIQHFGAEKTIAKKILSVYDDTIIPVFITDHMLHFYRRVVGERMLPIGFGQLSVGRKYQVLMEGLLRAKNEDTVTRGWDNYYFMKFLYDAYPTAQAPVQQPSVDLETLRSNGLNDEPKSEQEVLFLFAHLHADLGFPSILKVQANFPDVIAVDDNRNPVKIEIEFRASHFLGHGHPTDGCDVVVCWEDDMGDSWLEQWPRVVSLREHLSSETS